MSSLQQKLKINNSYESEPSSGSGSSLSEHNEHNYDIDNLHLPDMLKPKTFIAQDANAGASTATVVTPINHIGEKRLGNENRSTSAERKFLYGIPLHSSQESSFEGFNDSPFGNVQKQLYPVVPKVIEKVVEILPAQSKNLDIRSSPHKTFSKIYDTVVQENSCNAVDMQLSKQTLTTQYGSHLFVGSSSASGYSALHTAELSFNGKIKSLTLNETAAVSRPSTVTLPLKIKSSHTSAKLTDSSILERSPDLFGDDDSDRETEEEKKGCLQQNVGIDELAHDQQKLFSSSNLGASFIEEPTMDSVAQTLPGTQTYTDNYGKERELLRRIRKCLAGVPPPPSLTIPQLDMFQEVLSRKTEILSFFSNATSSKQVEEEDSNGSKTSSLFKPTHSVEETKTMSWQDVRSARQHGLCLNLNKTSEHIEYLSLAVIERFIGAETASSYRNSPSSAKKRSNRLKLLTQSPGSRLSHLAKRRAIFSSAHLATTSQKCNTSLGPQIMLDKRKTKNRRKATPKRKTPSSRRKNRKTPSSSARKRLFRTDIVKPGPSRETSKRALFQSPAKERFAQQKSSAISKPLIKPAVASRVEKSKRALFSPDLSQSLPSSASGVNSNFGFERKTSGGFETLLKRKRTDDEDGELCSQSSKLFSSSQIGDNLTPRALKIKSQSFCVGAGSSSLSKSAYSSAIASTVMANQTVPNSSISSMQLSASGRELSAGSGASAPFNAKMQRAHSDMVVPTNNLTENQRKKLLWAVSQALQEKKITTKHESFKQYASVLARVVRRIFQEYYQKNSTSNSETLLRLAKKYVYNVICGRNADDIYFQAKAQLQEAKRLSSTRLSGYIAPEDYANRKLLQSQNSHTGSCQNIFSMENSIDSSGLYGLSGQTSHSLELSSASTALPAIASQHSFLGHISHGSHNSETTTAVKQLSQTKQMGIQQNPTLQNSSSKNNLGGFALRENVDCEQRRSAQKNFTGKDQRNVSPYADGSTRFGSGAKLPSALFGEANASGAGAKVKRQITFDS